MPYRQLLQFITPHRRTLLGIVVLLLGGTAISLLNPLIAGKLTETLLNGPAATGYTVTTILVAWFFLMVINALVSGASHYYIGTTGAGMSAELRSRVYEHMQVLPLSYFQQRKQGDILSLLSNDAETISGFVTNTLVQLLPLLLTFFTAFFIMSWLDPVIALLAGLLLPAYYLVMKILGRKLRPLSSAWVQSRSDLVALVNENLGLIPIIKSFTREPLESLRFRDRNEELFNLSRQQIKISSILAPAVGLLAGLGTLLLLWVGSRHLASGQLQPSELVSLLLYAMLLTRPLASLANIYGYVMTTRGAAQRLLDFFGEEAEPEESGNEDMEGGPIGIRFENITFSYPGRPSLLENFDLEIEPGETIALTGANGAGKSTLAHLLLRFIQPQEGQILLNDIGIEEIQLSSLRSRIGLVAQNTLLLNGSIAENICYGVSDASEEEMKKAAEAARADQFIKDLPDGYDTLIGEHGIRLSGGQRQRLALARALLKHPSILVLDEATAMFDPEGEQEFIKAFREKAGERTVLLITHRPASLKLADRIIEM